MARERSILSFQTDLPILQPNMHNSTSQPAGKTRWENTCQLLSYIVLGESPPSFSAVDTTVHSRVWRQTSEVLLPLSSPPTQQLAKAFQFVFLYIWPLKTKGQAGCLVQGGETTDLISA